MDGTVLLADDDRTIRTVLTQALTRAGCKVHATASLVTLMRWVEEGRGDLVISDVVMPDGNGLETLPQIAALRPGLPVIVISAQNTIMTAIAAAERAAYDYLPKPFDLPDLLQRCARALDESRRRKAEPVRPQAASAGELPLVGRTPAMQALYRVVARIVNTEIAVLISGASGTGKSLIARAIHDLSDRRAQPFVAVRAAEFLDADGASKARARARAGTLLFDELGDFDAEAQARAVCLLDSLRESAPGSGPRVMATTQSDLVAAMQAGGLRRDLYYRLAGATLAVPLLRERVDDLPLLAEHFLRRFEPETGRRQLTSEALAALRAYAWPGNVRQLENMLRRLAVTSATERIGRAEAEAVLAGEPAAESAGQLAGDRLATSIALHLQRYFDLHGGELPPPGLYQRILREMETPLLEIALAATGGNQAKCADLLGINRNTLHKKITELDIRVTRRRKLM